MYNHLARVVFEAFNCGSKVSGLKPTCCFTGRERMGQGEVGVLDILETLGLKDIEFSH